MTATSSRGPLLPLPVLPGRRVTLRQVTTDDLAALAEVVAAPGVREWWGPQDDPARVREKLWRAGSAFAIEADQALAGWLAVDEVAQDDYPEVAFDIVLAPAAQNRGLGSDALRTAIQWFVDARGHHRFTIDPSTANVRAIRAYEAVGYRPVGVLHAYERLADGAFHDALLMELIAGEPR